MAEPCVVLNGGMLSHGKGTSATECNLADDIKPVLLKCQHIDDNFITVLI